MENLKGRKIKGFKYPIDCEFKKSLEEQVGKVGKIIKVNAFDCSVQFEDMTYGSYPLDQVEEHLIPEYEINKEYEFSDGGAVWIKRKLLAIINHEFMYVVESRHGSFAGYRKIREFTPKLKELTLEEAEEKLTQFLGIQIKIKK